MAQDGRKAHRGFSLKWGLLLIVALCWAVPISAILAVTNRTVESNVHERIRSAVSTSVDTAFSQTVQRFSSAMDASRAASYDNVIRSAYLDYLADGDGVTLYGKVSGYLSSQYAYDDSFRATYLFFTDDPENIYFISNRSYSSALASPRTFRTGAQAEVIAMGEALGTGIGFLPTPSGLYMVRNIVDSRFEPLAVIAMECNLDALTENVDGVVWLKSATLRLNGHPFDLTGGGPLPEGENGIFYDQRESAYTAQREDTLFGHRIALTVVSDSAALTDALSGYRMVLFACILLAVPLLVIMIWAFYRSVTVPVNTLVDAAAHVKAGERGYQVAYRPNSREFRYLTDHFNSMSTQLRYQFERSYEEQMALQDARVKALRSQINPHFLNNTLEVISWEARMARNEKVCSMIEALSTMLDAATARGGAATGTVRQELTYVDAYLYIISERYGGRLSIHKEIEPDTLSALVPCLILQPIVENAIEHGISARSRGELTLRSRLSGGALVLEVEHDGGMSEGDRAAIERLLRWDGKAGGEEPDREHIGIRNVNRRLKLLCGEESGLTISMAAPERVLARIVIPDAAMAAE